MLYSHVNTRTTCFHIPTLLMLNSQTTTINKSNYFHLSFVKISPNYVKRCSTINPDQNRANYRFVCFLVALRRCGEKEETDHIIGIRLKRNLQVPEQRNRIPRRHHGHVQ